MIIISKKVDWGDQYSHPISQGKTGFEYSDVSEVVERLKDYLSYFKYVLYNRGDSHVPQYRIIRDPMNFGIDHYQTTMRLFFRNQNERPFSASSRSL